MIPSSLAQFLGRTQQHTRKRSSLVVFVGAGVEHGHEPDVSASLVSTDKLAQQRLSKKPDSRSRVHSDFLYKSETKTWDEYEFARLISLSYPPPIVLYTLRELVHAGLVQCIVSLNYTSFLETALLQDGKLAVLRNPILTGSQYDPEGYYSNPHKHRPQPSTLRAVSLFSPHGTLAFASFKNCPCDLTDDAYWRDPHIFRLPGIPVSNGIRDIASLLADRAAKRGHHAQFHRPTFVRNKRASLQIDPPHVTSDLFHHHIDWNDDSGNRRLRFKHEIAGTRAIIERVTNDPTHGILLLGFTAHSGTPGKHGGYYGYNEELANPLLKLAQNRRTKNRLWAVISQTQHSKFVDTKGKGKPVLAAIEANRNLLGIPDDTHICWERFSEDLLASCKLKPTIGKMYNEWKDQFFFPNAH